MVDRELSRLSRKQLLELLLRLTERSEDLQQQLIEANEKLEKRLLIKSEVGSIAEAALKLNGVFEAADKAAEQYLYNVQKLSDEQDLIKKNYERQCKKKMKAMLVETYEICKAREAESRTAAEALIVETERKCRELEREASRKYDEARKIHRYLLEQKNKLNKQY